MDDCINRQAALKTVQDMYDRCDTGSMQDYHDLLMEAFEILPSVDAVEVVRCRDCKWFGKIGCAINIVDESDKPHEDDFCSRAERRTDESD